MKKLSTILVALLMTTALLSGCYSTACTPDGKNVYDKQMKDSAN